MKKQTSILAFVCISIFMLTPLLGSAGTAPTVTNWTWSEELRGGSYFAWDVLMYNNSDAITQVSPDGDGPPFTNGSYLEVWVDEDPYGLSADNDQNLFSQYFTYGNNGNYTFDPEVAPVLVFPNTYQTTTGDYNYFHYVDDFGYNFTMFDNLGETSTISMWFNGTGSEELYTAQAMIYKQGGTNVTESFTFGSGDGVLRNYHRSEVDLNGNHIWADVHLVRYDVNDEDDFLRYASFDPSLNAGDSFTWDVTMAKSNGVNITTFGNDGPPPAGTEVRIDIVGEPEEINFTQDVNAEDYFEFYIDDVQYQLNETFDGPGDFIQFIFPKNFDFGNGTTIDFFEFAASAPQEVWDSSDDVSATLANGLFTLEIDESWEDGSSSQILVFDANTGVMQYLYRYETYTQQDNSQGSVEFELVLHGFTDIPGRETSSNPSGTDESTSAGLPLPGFTIYITIGAFIAIPILRRRK